FPPSLSGLAGGQREDRRPPWPEARHLPQAIEATASPLSPRPWINVDQCGSMTRRHTRRASHRVALIAYSAQLERQNQHQDAEGRRKSPEHPEQRQRADRRENGDE